MTLDRKRVKKRVNKHDNNKTKTVKTIKIAKKVKKSKKPAGVAVTKQEIRKDAKRIRDDLDSRGFANRVAYNTKSDAAKYNAIPTYAYRPASSPQHIFKNQTDLVKLLNQYRDDENLKHWEQQQKLEIDRKQNDQRIKTETEEKTKYWEFKRQQTEATMAKDAAIHKAKMAAKQQEHDLAIQKIHLEYARQIAQLKAENDKIATQQALENSPDYKKLIEDRDKALKTQYELEQKQLINKRNEKIQREIDHIKQQIALINIEDSTTTKALQEELRQLKTQYEIEKNNEALKQQISQVKQKLSDQRQKNNKNRELQAQLASKQQELINMKAEASQYKNIAKLEREAAEIQAQRGKASQLHQMMIQHESELQDLKQTINAKQTALNGIQQEIAQYRPVADQLTKQTQQDIENTQTAINKLIPFLAKEEINILEQQRDPTSALIKLREIGQQKIERRQRYVDRAIDIAKTLYEAVEGDPIMAKVGKALVQAQRVYNEKHGQLQATDIPDFEKIIIDKPPPDIVENSFDKTFT